MRGRMKGDKVVWPQLGPACEVQKYQKLPDHKTTSQYTCLVASWPGWVSKPLCELGVEFLLRWYVSPSPVGPALPGEIVRVVPDEAAEAAA